MRFHSQKFVGRSFFLGDIRELLAGQDTRWCLRVSEVG